MLNASTLRAGARLGKYEILKPLTVGGMAELFLARATGPEGFQKVVVLKRVQPALAEDPDLVTMFLDEARLAATLNHPNIAQVHDFGETEGSYYFTMEYVHGHDLLAITEALENPGESSLPLAASVSIGLGLTAGLHYAHEKRDHKDRPLDIVHRDVSLGNVLVSKDGYVKLVDFGIAKAASRQHETRAGTVRGKVWYMSPEQTAGKTLDRRTDIYSAGVVLYRLTTGLRPFDGESPMEVANKIRSGEFVRPTQHDSQYPPELEKVILRALQPNRKKRYQTAQEFHVKLEEFAHDKRLVTSPRALSQYLETLMGPQDATWVGAIPADDQNMSGEVSLDDFGSLDNAQTSVQGGAPPVRTIFPAGAPRVASLPKAKSRARPSGTAPARAVAAKLPPPKAPAKETSSGLWPLISLSCLGLAVGAYFYGQQERLAQDSPARSSELSDVDEVVLRVETKPAGARVEFGGNTVKVGLLRTKPSKAARVFRVSAPGYVPYQTRLVLAENTRMVIVLAAKGKSASSADEEEKKAERRRKRAERRRKRKDE